MPQPAKQAGDSGFTIAGYAILRVGVFAASAGFDLIYKDLSLELTRRASC